MEILAQRAAAKAKAGGKAAAIAGATFVTAAAAASRVLHQDLLGLRSATRDSPSRGCEAKCRIGSFQGGAASGL